MTNYWQGPITDNMATYLQYGIKDYAYTVADALGYFKAFDLIEYVPKGVPKVTSTIFEKMQPGQIGFGIEHVPVAKPHAKDIDTTLAVFASIVQLNKMQLDLWRYQTSPKIQDGSLLARALDQQLKSMVQQIDNFLFWGDDMQAKNVLDNDRRLNSGTWTGMLNGFTTLQAGAGTDDDVTAANDYWYTIDAYIKALKQAGHNSKQYIIFSDMDTWGAAGATNNFYTTTGAHENDLVVARADVSAWIVSPNAYDNSGTDYRMMLTTPRFKSIDARGNEQEHPVKPYVIKMGYDFEMVPIYGGQMDMQFNTNIGILVSLAIEETYPTAIQRSGALTH